MGLAGIRSLTVFLVLQAVLGLIPDSRHSLAEMRGSVININVPKETPNGFYMAHQGAACVFPAFREVFEQVDPTDEQGRRRFRNTAGDMQWYVAVRTSGMLSMFRLYCTVYWCVCCCG